MDLFEKYYTLSLHYLTRRPRSEKELAEYLKKKFLKRKIPEFDQQIILPQIIATLKKQKFLNDGEFVKWWTEQRTRFKPRSKRLIQLELLRKGISKELLDLSFKIQDSGVNDLEQAKRLVEKKLSRYKDLPKQELYQKLGRFLAGKGFDWDTIKEAIDETMKKGV